MRRERNHLGNAWLTVAWAGLVTGATPLVSCSEASVSDAPVVAEVSAAMTEAAPGRQRSDAARSALGQKRFADRAEDRYIVVFKPQTFRGMSKQGVGAKAADISNAFQARVHHVYQHAIEGMAVNISDKASLTRLKNDPRVAYVVPDEVVSVSSVQEDPPWGLDRIDQADNALDGEYVYESTGDDVHVYIIDTGLYAQHYEFAGRVSDGVDIIDADTAPDDCHGHGTHVAGTAVGSTFGVAKRAIVHPVRIFDCDGVGLTSEIIAGVDWVTGNHITPAVANMSLGELSNQALDDAVAASVDAGVFYTVSAGNNSGDDACNWSPASEPKAMTVAASDETDTIADFSNIGPCVDIFAPGVGVVSAGIIGENSFFEGSGTSMAAPHVAGAAALLLSKAPTMTPAEVTAAILDAAIPGVINGISDPTPNLLLNVEDLNRYGTGSLHIATNTVGCDTTFAIALTDQNLTGVDVISIDATTSSGDAETIVLERLDSASDSLHGRLFFSQGAPVVDDGYIQTADGVLVTLTYQDAEDADGLPLTVTETLEVDCTPPTVDNAVVTYAYGDNADIAFDISETSYVQIKYGESCDNLTMSYGHQSVVPPTHEMKLSGLQKSTTYYYSLTATDLAGNTGPEDDNDGLCYQLTTATEIYFEDFETDPVDFDLGSSQWRITDGCAATEPGHSAARALYFGDDSTCTFNTMSAGGSFSPTVTVDFDQNPSISFKYYEDMKMPINEVWVYLTIDDYSYLITGTIYETPPKLHTFYDEWIPVSIPIAEYGSGIQDVKIQFNLRAMFGDPDAQGFFVDDLSIDQWSDGAGCEDDVYEAETMTHSTGGSIPDGWNLWSNGYAAFNHTFSGGTQEMIVTAAGEYAAGWPEMRVTVNDQQVYSTTVASSDWTDYAFTFDAPIGDAEVRLYFTNDYYAPPQDRNLLLDKVTVVCADPGPDPGTLTAVLDVYASWSTGFCANLVVTNTGAAPTANWSAVVDSLDNAIVNSWNTVAVSGTGLHTFQPINNNHVINPGQTNSAVGFCADRSDDTTAVVVSATPVY